MLKLISGYQWDNGLLVGGSLRADSGRPINRLADWPQNDPGYGKLFVTPRGEAGRLPSTLTVNLHVEYAFKIKGSTLTALRRRRSTSSTNSTSSPSRRPSIRPGRTGATPTLPTTSWG